MIAADKGLRHVLMIVVLQRSEPWRCSAGRRIPFLVYQAVENLGMRGVRKQRFRTIGEHLPSPQVTYILPCQGDIARNTVLRRHRYPAGEWYRD